MYWHHLHATIKNSLNHTFHDRHRVSVVKRQNYNNLRATTDTLGKSSGAAGKATLVRLKKLRFGESAKARLKLLRNGEPTNKARVEISLLNLYLARRRKSLRSRIKAPLVRLRSQGDGESSEAAGKAPLVR